MQFQLSIARGNGVEPPFLVVCVAAAPFFFLVRFFVFFFGSVWVIFVCCTAFVLPLPHTMATITLHYISARRCGKDPSEHRFPRRSADKGKLVSVSLLLAVAFATIASMDAAAAALAIFIYHFYGQRQYQYIDFFSQRAWAGFSATYGTVS